MSKLARVIRARKTGVSDLDSSSCWVKVGDSVQRTWDQLPMRRLEKRVGVRAGSPWAKNDLPVVAYLHIYIQQDRISNLFNLRYHALTSAHDCVAAHFQVKRLGQDDLEDLLHIDRLCSGAENLLDE